VPSSLLSVSSATDPLLFENPMPAPTLRHRLAEWRTLVNVPSYADDPQAAGGRVGEQYLNALVGTHRQFRGANLYPNRRVPAGRRKREIDLIVVSPHRLHLIEVKNWSGSLHTDGRDWVQVNRAGASIRHPDLVADHRDKADALFAYLSREGVPLSPDVRRRYGSYKVLFVNPRLRIDSGCIASHPDVLTADRLDGYLHAQRRDTFGGQLAAALAGWCLDTDSAATVLDGLLGRLPADTVAKVNAAVGRLGTWDGVRFHGGRTDPSDLIRLRVGRQVIERGSLGRDGVVRVRWTRNRWWGLAKAITGWGQLGVLEMRSAGPDELRGVGSEETQPLGVRDMVLFHRAGDPQPVEIPLMTVNEIRLG